MKNKNLCDTAQSAYLLEYGKRKIKVCADTFQNLAQIFGEEEQEEDAGFQKEKKNGGEGTENRRQEAAMRHERTALFLKKSLLQERQLFADNLKEMADMMNRAAEESVRFIRLGSRRQKQIVRGLAGEGLTAREIYLVQREGGRMELSVLLSAKTSRAGGARTVEEAAGCLSVLLDMRLVSAKRNPFFIGPEPICYFFEEEPGYVYLTGTARAVKESETISGDNFACFEAGDANLILLLSDGMGSGYDACRDSEIVADMAESMLETGIGTETAVKLMNSALAGEGSRESLPTLDLCSLDLYEGECSFLKAGAAASFIKRGSAVEKITGETLPLGACGETGIHPVKRSVSDGDYIVMLTDGLTEGWPDGDGERQLEILLSGLNGISPSEMAGILLRFAIEQCGGRIRDDMTVLVAGVWEKS